MRRAGAAAAVESEVGPGSHVRAIYLPLHWSEIHALYRLTTPPANLQPRYNVCPTTTINTLAAREGRNELVLMRWGLIPSWWKKKAKETPATFNARAETVAEKPMFRSAFERRRCVVPASGYYEWRDTPDGKQPYYFTRRDEQPISIADCGTSGRTSRPSSGRSPAP